MAPRPKLSRYNSWMFSREFEAVELMHRECLRWYRLLLATFEHSTTTHMYICSMPSILLFLGFYPLSCCPALLLLPRPPVRESVVSGFLYCLPIKWWSIFFWLEALLPSYALSTRSSPYPPLLFCCCRDASFLIFTKLGLDPLSKRCWNSVVWARKKSILSYCHIAFVTLSLLVLLFFFFPVNLRVPLLPLGYSW